MDPVADTKLCTAAQGTACAGLCWLMAPLCSECRELLMQWFLWIQRRFLSFLSSFFFFLIFFPFSLVSCPYRALPCLASFLSLFFRSCFLPFSFSSPHYSLLPIFLSCSLSFSLPPFLSCFLPFLLYLLYLILSFTRHKSFIIVKTDVVFLWVFAGFLPIRNLYGDLPIRKS